MKLIIFDMGHVFVDFEWDEVCHAFSERAACGMESLKAVFREVSQLGYESGQIDTNDFIGELNQRLKTDISRAEFTAMWMTSFRENSEMAALMQRLKQQRPLYLLSNTNEVQFDWLESTHQVTRHFEETILSFQVGCSKPDPKIYQEVLSRSGLPASDCLFIDDLECNVEAAKTLGMETIKFVGVSDLIQNLSKYELML